MSNLIAELHESKVRNDGINKRRMKWEEHNVPAIGKLGKMNPFVLKGAVCPACSKLYPGINCPGMQGECNVCNTPFVTQAHGDGYILVETTN